MESTKETSSSIRNSGYIPHNQTIISMAKSEQPSASGCCGQKKQRGSKRETMLAVSSIEPLDKHVLTCVLVGDS